jgi:methyl-accepting chemotaxis protein
LGIHAFRLTKRFGLRARIMSLAAVPIIGLLAVMIIGRMAEHRQVAAERGYQARQALAEKLLTFTGDAGRMRMAADDYRRLVDEDTRKAFETAAEAASQTLAGYEALDDSAQAADLRKAFLTFVESFKALSASLEKNGRTTGDGKLGELAFAGLKLKGEIGFHEAQLGTWGPVLKDAVFELFLAERDFRFHQTNAYVNHFDRLHSNVVKVSDVAPLDATARKALQDGIDDYNLKFGNWVDGVQHAMALATRLNQNYLALGSRVSGLQATIGSQLAESRRTVGQVTENLQNWTLGLFGLVIALSILIAATVGLQAARELGGLSAAMRQLANGDAAVAIPAVRRDDEVGAMSAALTALRDGVRERQALVAANESSSATRLARARAIEDAVRQFESGISIALKGVHDAAGTMREVSQELDGAATEAEAQAIAAAGDTSRAASEIETAAVAAQQLSSSVEEVAGQAVRSDEAAAKALRETERVSSAMTELTRQAGRVGEIVGIISSIADQTNLLALNATIEAARAGESGRGFAVVASEVKQLAAQTVSATSEIAGQIEGIRVASAGVTQALSGMTGTIGEVSRIAGSVAAAVEEQSTALAGISSNIVAASEGATRGADGIRTVETAVADTTRNASRVRGMSETLAADADKLNEQVAWFLNEVRAA